MWSSVSAKHKAHSAVLRHAAAINNILHAHLTAITLESSLAGEELSSDIEEGDSEGGAKENFEETDYSIELDLFVKDTC